MPIAETLRLGNDAVGTWLFAITLDLPGMA
jgi:hypothetical protein